MADEVYISLVIPCLNEEKLLPKLLNSIKAIERSDFETIVIDNNSSDKTVQIAKTYGVFGGRCLKRGVGATRNMGARKAKGKYLAFLDADCILEKNYIEVLVNYFNDNSKCDAVIVVLMFCMMADRLLSM